MFRPDSDFFVSGDSASYHQDLLSVPSFDLSSSSRNRYQRHQKQHPGAHNGPPMSTRQNKKQRKGRNNANNRERTVTTLTEDPNTPYLVPTPSEEPAGSHMAAPFAGNIPGGGKMHNSVSMGPPQSFQGPNNYGGFGFTAPYSPVQNMHQQHQPQPQHQQPFFSSPPQQHSQQPQQHTQTPDVRPKVPLPPGKNDLEILQNLKKIIKDNQHPFYKAVPTPAALAKLYKGTIPTQPQQAGRRSEQAPSDYRNESSDAQTPQTPSSTSGFSQSAGENGRRPRPPVTGKDRRSVPAGGNQGNNSSQGNQGNRYNNGPGGNSVAHLNLQNLKISKNNAGPPSAGAQSESHSSDLTSHGPNQPATEAQRRGYEYSARYQKSDSASGGRPHDSGFDNMATDVSMTNKGSVYNGKDEGSRPGGWPSRDYAHPDDRDFDSERNVAPRPQAIAGSANVDARPLGGPDRGAGPPGPGDGYDRDRRRDWNDRDRDRRLSHDRRDTRPTDNRRSSSITDQRPFEADFGQPPVRRGAAEPPVPPDLRHLPSENPIAADRPPVESRPPPDARVEPRAAPARVNDRLGPETEDIQSSRSSSVRPMDAPAPLVSASAAAGGDDIVDDASLRPTLKERLNPPPNRASRTPTEMSGGPGEQQPTGYIPDRNKKPKFNQKDRVGLNSTYNGPPYDGPPKQGDRAYGRQSPPPFMPADRAYGRPPSPSGGPPPPMSGGPPPPHRNFQPRSPSLEGRPKGGPPPRGAPPRDFRGPPGRALSRDRAGYRPDFHEPRYPGGIDPDPRYEGRQYRDFSPPGQGGRGPPPGDGPPGRDYPQYPPGRRDWGPADEDDYYKSRNWDGPHEKGRYERDYGAPPRSGGWGDVRPDRDFVGREPYPPGPPGPLIDDRYPHPGPPIRDGDRGRPPPAGYNNPPPFNRVRPRSPSPPRRPGPGPVDDSRPPMKRAREDFGPDYYPPGGRDGPMRRAPGEYPPPPRSGSPGAPPNSGWAPPPSGSSAGGPVGGGPPGDRDYRMGRANVDYAPPLGAGGYDRRSPGPPSGRMAYNRGGGGGYGRGGGEPRDRGGYGMQRP